MAQARPRPSGLDLALLLSFDPYGDERVLTDDEIARLHDEVEALRARLESFLWNEPLPAELTPPSIVNEEMGGEPWDKDGAWDFADQVRALTHMAREFAVPLIADGD